jgi:hypothetical protein
LADPDGEAIGDHESPRHLRAPDEEHQRHCGEEEAQRSERERGNFTQTDLDRDERESPQRDDGNRQREVARREMGFQRGTQNLIVTGRYFAIKAS